jgi:peptide/nickel transport system substrate-binding protein
MKRREMLAVTGAALASCNLPRPALSQAATRTLKFIPEGNLQNPDPIWSTTTVARKFG